MQRRGSGETEDRMASVPLIQRVVHAALRTFGRRHPCQNRLLLSEEEFGVAFSELLELMDALGPNDVGLTESKVNGGNMSDAAAPLEPGQLRRGSTSSGSDKESASPSIATATATKPPRLPRALAPVTYIEVIEHPDVTIGIFIVKKGCSIPLHNHPNMFGIVKCLGGSFDLTSYTALDEDDASGVPLPAPLDNSDGKQLRDHGMLFPAKKEPVARLDASSRASVLAPAESNYHEIRAPDDTSAAFIDLLAPPYTHEGGSGEDDDGPPEERRDCDFFREAAVAPQASAAVSSDSSSKISWLQWIPPPTSYFCDSKEYCGPPVSSR